MRALSITLAVAAVALAGCASSGTSSATQGGASPATRTWTGTASAAPSSSPSPAASSPAFAAGFWSGTDSWPVTISGDAPFTTPVVGGSYGGYMGMAGNWARQLGCSTGNFLAWSSANATQASENYTTHHLGVGTGVYWYMGGPGVDPDYNGTESEASAWGAKQAAWALTAANADHVNLPVIWADIELPGIAPAPDNGWTSVYTSPCSGNVKTSSVPASVNRAEFDGFASYLTSHSSYKTGVYSSPSTWTAIFGTGSAAQIPNTYEWTYEPETASLSEAPSGWCLKDGAGCAEFFGGQTDSSPYALAWQWSGGGGVRNAYGDFDQIDASRLG
ncbi:MAG: hypothetical protein ABSA93_27175 [Streptosporangiaceae bacterium]|jgi:hypothetical protein